MLNPIQNFSKDIDNLNTNNTEILSSSFVNFCEKMGAVFDIKDFLLTLKTQIPKKFKTGELLLFYNSEQLGLKRAYVRNSIFYEETAKKKWIPVDEISPCSVEHNLYLAEEFGRPFTKSLMIPICRSELKTTALLFVEISQSGKLLESLKDFFEQRSPILNLIFKRAFLNTRWTRIPYLWSQLFVHWWEPLAILQNFKVLRSNEAFKKNLPTALSFLKQKKIPEQIETVKKIYNTHYYPISQPNNSNPTGILYCQDMTKHFHLKEQLFQSEKMASLCELGKNMAHQLNNPLTGIRSMVQILCQNPDLAKFEEELMEVEKATIRSQKIIENLLSFSQTQGKEITCNLNQVLEDTLPLLKSMTSGLLLKVELCKHPVEVSGDFAVLQQVAYNLILNACQALRKNKEKKNTYIQITTSKTTQNKACLKIKDNGPGIAKHNLEKIFQPLWTNKNKGQGTGFGLSISRQFVRKLGGDIFVDSRENEFACFTVLLPLGSSKSI